MAWVDRKYIPVLEQDWRYARMINLSRRLLEDKVPKCGNCNGGQNTIQDDDGNEITVTCGQCLGSGEVPNPVDNEDNGQADAGRK